MRFTRLGEHTIKCIISEDEIFDLGYTLDDIMSNGERTQEFMNHIFDMAEQEFSTKFDLGIKTVRADFLPDHSVALTFSEHPEANEMVEHLKDIVNSLLKNASPAEAAKTKVMSDAEADDDDVDVVVLLEFDTLDIATRFAKQVNMENMPYNALYKNNGKFYIFMDLNDCTEQEVVKLSMITDEYVSDILVGPEKYAYFEEHCEVIISSEAIQQLKQI